MDEAEPFYGHLEHIIILRLPPSPAFGPDFTQDTTFHLACVSHCDLLRGVDARNTVTMFNNYLAQQYIHMGAIGAVVGLVKQGRHFGIIDRSSELAKPVFVRNEEIDEDFRQLEG